MLPVSGKRVFLKLYFLWDLFKLNQLCVVCGADFVSCVECKLIAVATAAVWVRCKLDKVQRRERGGPMQLAGLH